MKQKVLELMKKVRKIYINEPVVQMAVIAFLVNLIVESFSRHSVIGGLEHLFNHPIFFGYNVLIIFMMCSFGLLFRRRDSWVMLSSVFWIVLGIINAIVLFFRVTPLSLIDFSIAKSGITMLHIYLNTFQIVLMSISIVLAITGIVYAWIKLPKRKIPIKRGILTVIVTAIVVFISTNMLTAYATKNGSFAVLTKAYDDIGFVYCFSRSIVDNGIDKPRNYSKLAIDTILNEANLSQTDNELRPNLIFLQLESFFDVSYLKNIECPENPIPNFTKLKELCSTGKLRVPSMGGGTANTEFEVLTGMNLDNFGIGEYPYQTVLKGETCESLAYIFCEKGYKTTAIHNHTATFYGRNKVYPNLGFETFIPVEYMCDVEKNEISWAKDKVLKKEILETLESSEDRDFIFAVSVQSHGKYPKDEIEYNKLISVDNMNFDSKEEIELKNEFEYYINQIHEVDVFLGELIEALKNYPEPVALVVYGDHLPALPISDDDLNGINEYQTEYCIWTNYSHEKKDNDICAYQLSSVVLNRIDMDGGILPKIHQTFKNDDRYKYYLKLISYDILYGENYSNIRKRRPVNMKFGLNEIKIDDVINSGDLFYIKGEGFTEYSYVIINSKKIDTIYINSGMLAVLAEAVPVGTNSVEVSQINSELVKLSTTSKYTFINDTKNHEVKTY